VPWRALFALASALAIAAGLLLGRMLAGSRRRWLGIGTGVALAVANHMVLRLDYPGTHFVAAWLAAWLTGASALCWVAKRNLPRPARLTAVAAAVLALLSYASIPGPVVRSALLSSSGAVAAPFATRAWAKLRSDSGAAIGEYDPEWFTPRWNKPPIPAELLPGAPAKPIVILLTIDALRASVVQGRKFRPVVPNFRAMALNGVRFARAWSPAAATMASLRSLLHGTFYSQAVDRAKAPPEGAPEQLYLAHVLDRAGVTTVNVSTSRTFAIAKGITAGFREEIYIGDHAPSEVVVTKVLERVTAGTRGPLLLYSHIFDPHSPYDRGKREGSLFDRYVSEISVVDAAIGTLRRALKERKLDQHTYLIVTGDHAEAFGEHGRHHHGTTVYEEMIKVPLLIEGPGIKPHFVNRSVSGMDVAPSVLSLFGLPTPAYFMGQSLVPYMRGENPRLSRPLAVDTARHIRAMLFRERWKAIIDVRRGTEELFDLEHDPGELNNLAGQPHARAYFATLRAFFAGMNQQPEGDPSGSPGEQDAE
jgi:hypothetical protein